MRWLGYLALAVATCFSLARFWPTREHVTTSFAGYWVVARELREGTPVARLYDEAFLSERMRAHGIGLAEVFLGPPTLALTALPVAELDYPRARQAWVLGFSLPVILASCLALARRGGPGVAWAMAAVMASPAVGECLEVGQVYGFALGLHVLALWAAEGGRFPAWAGLVAAPMMATRG
ncbi:MAG: DUF2029 domain-containing protein, partial [Deltaproteobacteria bacterium]|nr:DUF2029 domain-containing protein [Deltaproteobacteria bacterium]